MRDRQWYCTVAGDGDDGGGSEELQRAGDGGEGANSRPTGWGRGT